MLVIERFPPGEATAAPPGWHRCTVRGCATRLPEPGKVCAGHGDVTPGDLLAGVPFKAIFPF